MPLTLVQIALIKIVQAWNVQIIQAGDVPMSPEMLQQLHFSQGTLGQDLLAEHIGDLLDSNALAGLAIGGGADNTICTLTQLFRHRVPLVDDELLVEDLERLASIEVTHIVLRVYRCW